MDILVFETGGRRFGVPAADVVEIVRAVALEPLPGAPASVEGLLNLRGRTTPVFSSRAVFGLAASPLDPSEHLVVLRAGERVLAIRVDRAVELLSLPEHALDAPAALGAESTSASVIGRLPDGLLVIQDAKALLKSAGPWPLSGGEA